MAEQKIFVTFDKFGFFLNISETLPENPEGWEEMTISDFKDRFKKLDPNVAHWVDDDDILAANPKHAPYYQELGRFIQVFAEVEMAMMRLLVRFCKVSDAVARSIFSGIKVEVSKQYITRIMDAENYPDEVKNELKPLFDQLGLINSTRNDIVHFGTQFDESGYFVTNAAKAHLPSRVSIKPVSVETLKNMVLDLNKISMSLLIYEVRNAGFEISAEAAEKLTISMTPILKRAWQYKPNVQAPPS